MFHMCDEYFNFKDMIHSIFKSEGVPNMDLETLESICNDTKQAIKLIIQQSMKFADKNNHISMTVDDVKLGMKSKGVLPFYGFSVIQDGNDRVIDLHDIINEPLPKVPLECSLKGEYLAIEGVNPRMEKLQTNDDNNNNIIDPGYYNKSTTTSSDGQSSRKRKHVEEVEFAEILIPSLTFEQEDFITNTISCCMGLEDDKREYALDCLRTGICINPFLSNFVNFINRSIRFNVVRQNLVKLVYLLKMCQALLDNKTIVWESHLDDVVESLVTCLLYTALKVDDPPMMTLRGFVSNILKHVFQTFKQARVLESRVCNILSATLKDTTTSFDIQFVALQFLSRLGHETIVNYILPHTKRLSEKISLLKDYEGNLTPEAKDFVVCLSKAINPIILKTKNLLSTRDEFQEEYGFELSSKLYKDLKQQQNRS